VPGNVLQRRRLDRTGGLLRKITLSPSGAAAAVAVGAAAAFAGVDWITLLLVFFVAATAVTGFRRVEKQNRARALLEKAGPRDAAQVVANGAAFALGAVLFAVTADGRWMAFAAGALAAASADTWATELGLLSSSVPRSIVSGRRVSRGTSGGVTLAGTAAGVLGAFVVTTTAFALGWQGVAVAAGAAGLLGMTADSLLGATVQERRSCPACVCETEARVHSCGTPTQARGGVRGLDNDLVNALATFSGAVFATLIYTWSM
jgi:uncharacterized protein (TIGR00297 family)